MLLRNVKIGEETDGDIEIHAVVTRKQYNLLITGQATIEVPEGVSMYNRKGTRFLKFTCEDREIADVLEDALDISGLSWQEGV